METYAYRGVAELRTLSGEPVAETTFWVAVRVPPKGRVEWEGWLRKRPSGGDGDAPWQGRYQLVVAGGGTGQIEVLDEPPMKLLEGEYLRFRGASRPPEIPAAPLYPQNPVPYPPPAEAP